MRRVVWTLGLAAALGTTPALVSRATAQETRAERHDVDTHIQNRLKADATLRHFDIDVAVNDRVAVLTGTVRTESDRARAGRLARVTGIDRVDNKITVDRDVRGTSGVVGKSENVARDGGDAVKHGAEATGNVVTDGWITSRIHERFMGVDELKGSDINVDTNAHVVTLKGTVLSEAGRRRAVELAKGTEGVHEVVDRLAIGPKR